MAAVDVSEYVPDEGTAYLDDRPLGAAFPRVGIEREELPAPQGGLGAALGSDWAGVLQATVRRRTGPVASPVRRGAWAYWELGISPEEDGVPVHIIAARMRPPLVVRWLIWRPGVAGTPGYYLGYESETVPDALVRAVREHTGEDEAVALMRAGLQAIADGLFVRAEEVPAGQGERWALS